MRLIDSAVTFAIFILVSVTTPGVSDAKPKQTPAFQVANIAGKAQYGISIFRQDLEAATPGNPFPATRRAFECGQAVARLDAAGDGLDLLFDDQPWAPPLAEALSGAAKRFVFLVGHQAVSATDRLELIEHCRSTEILLGQVMDHLKGLTSTAK